MKMAANQTRKLRLVTNLGGKEKKKQSAAVSPSKLSRREDFELKTMPLGVLSSFPSSATYNMVASQSKSFRLFTTMPEGVAACGNRLDEATNSAAALS